jgi:hypothetical protein
MRNRHPYRTKLTSLNSNDMLLNYTCASEHTQIQQTYLHESYIKAEVQSSACRFRACVKKKSIKEYYNAI